MDMFLRFSVNVFGFVKGTGLAWCQVRSNDFFFGPPPRGGGGGGDRGSFVSCSVVTEDA
jgi:hypothetical protein